MPTGYTADIAKGITFKEYALGCARAFGALIQMRDDPKDAEIPDKFEPSDYYPTQIRDTKEELARLDGMDVDALDTAAKAAFSKNIEYHQEQIIKNQELEAKYRSMLAEVHAYKSPSREHDEFKSFMATQITGSIEFDCMGSYHENEIKSTKLMSGSEWLESERQKLTERLKYLNEENNKEIQRANERSEWVRKLRESLQ